MSGPGAEAGIYGKTYNIVLLPTPSDGVNTQEYHGSSQDRRIKNRGLSG